VDSFADANLPNAQMGNAREIVSRLDPERFHVTMFVLRSPDTRVSGRKNTRLIQLPAKRQTVRILREFLCGDHAVLFYLKPSPASRWYLSLRTRSRSRTILGTVESQSDLCNEPTINPESIRLWEQTVLRCDRLFSNSGSVQKSLMDRYGRNSDIIPTGVDTSYFTPGPGRAGNSRLHVLFAGSLRVFKQPQFLLDAAARFPHVDFRLAGDGPLRPTLKDRIVRDRLSNVALLGMLSSEELRQEYRSTDVFLFPSTWEGSPKVLLEAAACGLPSIIRNVYAAETVVHGKTGFQAASDEDLFSYLGILLSNPQLRKEFGQNARQHSEKYDWNLITRHWEQTFLLSEPRQLRSVS
jgi:glycosyltransferase involved in cell wall biosynthesis